MRAMSWKGSGQGQYSSCDRRVWWSLKAWVKVWWHHRSKTRPNEWFEVFPLKITQAVLPITLRSQFKTLFVVCNEVPLCLDTYMLHVICNHSLAIMPVYISNTSFCWNTVYNLWTHRLTQRRIKTMKLHKICHHVELVHIYARVRKQVKYLVAV